MDSTSSSSTEPAQEALNSAASAPAAAAPPAPTVDALKEAGNAAFAAGRYAAAIEAYSAAMLLPGGATNHVLYSNRSACFLARGAPGDVFAALSDANACVRLAPSFAKGYTRKAAALVAMQSFAEAAAAASAGLKREPSNAGLRDVLKQAQDGLAAERAAEAQAEEARERAAAEAAAAAVDPMEAFMAEIASLDKAKSGGAAEGGALAGTKRPRSASTAAAEEDTYDRAEQEAAAAAAAAKDEDSEDDGGSGNGSSSGGAGSRSTALLTATERAALSASLAAQDLGTGAAQLDRLLQPNWKWINLNPYDVLALPPAASDEDIETRYRRLSALVHPDKHAGDARAPDAFQEVKKARDVLINEPTRRLVIVAAIEHATQLARRARKRDAAAAAERAKGGAAGRGGTAAAPPALEPLEAYITRECRKAFADMEFRRRQFEARAKKQAEREVTAEADAAAAAAAEAAAEAAWAEGAVDRMSAWQSFQAAKRPKLDGSKPAGEGGIEAGDAYKKRWR